MLLEDNTDEVTESLLIDITPISLGIRMIGDKMCPMIPKNTPIPATKTCPFVTTIESQTAMQFVVFQGESKCTKKNLLLGGFRMNDIPSDSAKRQRVEVTFEIDINGILYVKAVLQSTRKEIKISIDTRGNLCKTKIDEMVEQAQQFNQDDAQRQKAREAKNELERLCWNIKSFSFEGVPPSELEKIMEKCNDILEWLQTTLDR